MGKPYCFWKQSALQNHRYGEKCAPKTSFSCLSQTVRRFLRRKLKNCIWYPISHTKGYIHFCRPTPRSLKNSRAPKIIFRRYFGKYYFFRKSCPMENIQNVDVYKKGYMDFCRQTPPPLKTVMFSHKWSSRSFLQKYRFFRKTCFIIKHPFPNS